MEKGASSWFSGMSIRAIGYVLNKQEFRDATYMKYGQKIDGTPIHCACGEIYYITALHCKLGRYTSMRHDLVRDSEDQIMREFC